MIALAIVGKGLKLSQVNPVFYRFFSITDGESVAGRSLFQFVELQDMEAFKQAEAQLWSGGNEGSIHECTLISGPIRLPAQLMIYPLAGDQYPRNSLIVTIKKQYPVRFNKSETMATDKKVKKIPTFEASDEKEEEIQKLKWLEEWHKARQQELETELEYRNQELLDNLTFITQKNSLLKAVSNSLKKIANHPKTDPEVRQEIEKLYKKIHSQKLFEESYAKLRMHFEKIYPHFFNHLKNTAPGLTEKELRHCAYVKMGLTNKEVSQLLNVRHQTIEMARYRIKKKLHLGKEISLFDFMRDI